MIFNWPNYSEKLIANMFLLSSLLAATLLILTVKIIKNKKNDSLTKIGFALILFITIVSISFPLVVLGGYLLKSP